MSPGCSRELQSSQDAPSRWPPNASTAYGTIVLPKIRIEEVHAVVAHSIRVEK